MINNYISFTQSSNCFLNISYPSNFTFYNTSYKSSLQFYIKRKQDILDRFNLDLSHKILETNDPTYLLLYNKKLNLINNKDWTIRLQYDIMTTANTLKFYQNKELYDMLLDTNNKIIIYDSDDEIWGSPGQNLLGVSLMETRCLLKSLNKSKL